MGHEPPQPFQWEPELHNLPPELHNLPPPLPLFPSSSSSSSSSEFDIDDPEPILIKTFFKFQKHHSQADFAQALKGDVPSHNTLIHTLTMDINLRDISNTIRDQALSPVIRNQRNIMFCFAVVHLHAAPAPGQYRVRKVGRTMCNAERIIDDGLMLEHTGFKIGDFLDVAVRFPGGRKKTLLRPF